MKASSSADICDINHRDPEVHLWMDTPTANSSNNDFSIVQYHLTLLLVGIACYRSALSLQSNLFGSWVLITKSHLGASLGGRSKDNKDRS